jgi:hypothetical protein
MSWDQTGTPLSLEQLGALIPSDGYDGDLVFDGTSTVAGLVPSNGVYTLTRDLWPNNMTVLAAATIKTTGFCIYAKGTINNANLIHFNGNPGVTITGGASFTTQGTLYLSGGGGGNGRSTTGVGTGGSGSGGSNVARSSGGNGGNADVTNTGGTGNATAVPAAGAGDIHDLGFGTRRRLLTNVTLALANCGGGGGGGGCNVGTGTASSGAGGAAAGGVLISCAVLINTGIISADGGAGANGSATGNGIGAGGGGGAGGWVWVAARKIITRGVIRALGGAVGTSAGTPSVAPAMGTAGVVVVLSGS